LQDTQEDGAARLEPQATARDLLGRLAVPRAPHQGPAPFLGGWIGYLGHEFGARLLELPVAPPRAPARPAAPWAHLRLYADVLILDHITGKAHLVLNDLAATPMPERRQRALRLLATPVDTSPPPKVDPTVAMTLDADAFQERVKTMQGLVRQGDCFQANLTSSHAFAFLETPKDEQLITLYETYTASNPGPWGAYYDAPGLTILSSSPELLFEVQGQDLRLRPIAGTRARGATHQSDAKRAHELATDPKEQAEHAMLVDLARNDAARVATPASVRVPSLGGIERYRHVMHLVSQVEAKLRPEVTAAEVIEATFPGGTVTGAPKRRATQRIAELEGGPRGPYTGAFGYVSLTGDAQFNLLIRTLTATPTHLVAHAGCGIVEGSRPEQEAEELAQKALAQIDAALGHATPAPAEARCGHVDPGAAWSPPSAPGALSARVLLIDFEDSFVHTLADYVRRLGASATVHSVHDPAGEAWTSPPTHVILSPGPGSPADFPAWQEHAQRARRLGLPILGVCLGHQALAEEAGGRIRRHPETVHGRATPVRLEPEAATDPLLSTWRPGPVGRYHSLIAEGETPELVPLARLPDGTLMAHRHRQRPEWGLQFHPESLLTHDGLTLIRNFLETGRDR
jgi:anthranilate synthase